jgi:nitrile hydratase subunit alpha
MNIGWSQLDIQETPMDREDHDHTHDRHAPIEDREELTYYEKRTWAIQALLVEKGIITADEVRQQIEAVDARTPADGAAVVARAWVDPVFKARLLRDAKAAVAELGFDSGEAPVLVAVENTPKVHNVVVCTLCSCYPRALLGLPPDWYKSLSYRSRAVVDPRGVLREFGLELEPDVEVRVFDSSADMRYLVVPERPPRTEHMSEAELATLVTRDSMIGVTKARTPEQRPDLKAAAPA